MKADLITQFILSIILSALVLIMTIDVLIRCELIPVKVAMLTMSVFCGAFVKLSIKELRQ